MLDSRFGQPIIAYRIYAWSLPLIRPVTMKGQLLEQRQGLLMQLRDASGYEGWGEVAPFAGLQPESLEQAQVQLRQKLADLEGKLLMGFVEPAWPGSDTFASVAFGLEMALLNLRAARQGKDPAELLGPNPRPEVELNVLLTGSAEAVFADAKTLLQQGYRAFKLKVGHQPEADAELVRELRHRLGPGIRLRLDANRSWSLAQALAFGHATADCDIDYLEEPVANVDHLNHFHQETGIALALDESLIEPGD
ncbi:MAG: o-succinylbenzoate synthase, partial [Candidatus Sericytochromatia bacterium]